MELLEDALNLDPCAHQTNIQTKIPESNHILKVLEARQISLLKPVSYTHLTLPTIYSV